MAEQDNPYAHDTETRAPERRRGVDAFTLVLGIGTLLVSAYVLSDGATWLPAFDLKWVLAGGAVLVGVLMLGASMRGGRRD
ncbi:hypothetical protein [Amycolatopsis thermophila]|uniref:Integral membrane protein n=1 Tax=Amycolatopsis thermophila TaxID=206084 RepID=A0ABU0EQC4_9PSEU|nr:hypothetical protein [Amycolatopsis thermophila]MDQ0377462.1 hypothetical protein [Amycolatopsis thermophila]